MKIEGNVLVVDDDRKVYEQICRYLEHDRCMVEYASNLEEAEQKMRQDHYDVVFLDLVLPKYSGLEVLEDIREKMRKMPEIILMTAYDAKELEKQALDMGAFAVMHKPLDELRIQVIVEDYLKYKRKHAGE